jgi:hypothetical protein
VFQDVGVVASVEGVTVVHGGSWKAAEFTKTVDVAQTARSLTKIAKRQAKKAPVKPLQNRG